MQADREAGFLNSGPERVVSLVPVVGEPKLCREDRELKRLAPAGRDPPHFGDGAVDIVNRNLIRNNHAVGGEGAELGHRLIEGACRFSIPFLQEIEVSEGAHFTVHNGLINPVCIHVIESRLSVCVARPTRGGIGAFGEGGHASNFFGRESLLLPPKAVGFRAHGLGHAHSKFHQGRVVGGMVFRRQVGLDCVMGEIDMVIGRDEAFGCRHAGISNNEGCPLWSGATER